ncbi:MAG TPA: hypothetical protein VGX94_03970 [Terriglobia bacterium]|nr:hypothetical protein [Terriglobia bacterium]
MANPQIIYNPGTGPVALAFTYPPRNVAAYNAIATRHDNVASSGVRESILERVDNFLEFDMQTVLIGSDVMAWNAFMQYALQGGQFAYYPDSSQPAFTNYLLEQTTWNAAYKAPGLYSFKLKFRQVVS